MNSETRELITNVLDTIRKDIKDIFGDDYIVDIKEPIENQLGLNAKDFFMMYSLEENIFYISYGIDTPSVITAELMRIICVYIDPNGIMIMHDHYFDEESNSVKYGMEAADIKQKESMKKRGHKKCVICERVFEEKYINSDGYCPDCLIIKPNIVWN